MTVPHLTSSQPLRRGRLARDEASSVEETCTFRSLALLPSFLVQPTVESRAGRRLMTQIVTGPLLGLDLTAS